MRELPTRLPESAKCSGMSAREKGPRKVGQSCAYATWQTRHGTKSIMHNVSQIISPHPLSSHKHFVDISRDTVFPEVLFCTFACSRSLSLWFLRNLTACSRAWLMSSGVTPAGTKTPRSKDSTCDFNFFWSQKRSSFICFSLKIPAMASGFATVFSTTTVSEASWSDTMARACKKPASPSFIFFLQGNRLGQTWVLQSKKYAFRYSPSPSRRLQVLSYSSAKSFCCTCCKNLYVSKNWLRVLKNSPSSADVSMEEGIVPCANTLTLAHVHKNMKLVTWAPVFNIYARKSSTYIYIKKYCLIISNWGLWGRKTLE